MHIPHGKQIATWQEGFKEKNEEAQKVEWKAPKETEGPQNRNRENLIKSQVRIQTVKAGSTFSMAP